MWISLAKSVATKQERQKMSEKQGLETVQVIDLFLTKNVFAFDGGIKLKDGELINGNITKRATQEGQVILEIELSSGHPNQFYTSFKFVTVFEAKVLVAAIQMIEMAGKSCADTVKQAIEMSKKLLEENEKESEEKENK